MDRAIYACAKCNKTFGRRYNADRHGLRKHDGMAIIFNKETNEISNKRKINDCASSSSSPITTTTTTRTDVNNDTRTISDPHDNNNEDFFSNPDSKLNNNTVDKEKFLDFFKNITSDR